MEIVVHFVQQGRQICKTVSPFSKTFIFENLQINVYLFEFSRQKLTLTYWLLFFPRKYLEVIINTIFGAKIQVRLLGNFHTPWLRLLLEKCLFVPALKDSILQVNGQIYDSEVCHCVYPASRTFLNSFYTLGTQYSLKIAILFCSTIVFSPLADIRLKSALMKGPFLHPRT